MSNVEERVEEGQDVIDSRDIIERIGELREQLHTDVALSEEERDELKKLEALQEECNWGDWQYGTSLIADSYFQEYAEALAEDIGAVQKDASWPNNHIDWEAAADSLKQDYTSVQYGETEYWVRS